MIKLPPSMLHSPNRLPLIIIKKAEEDDEGNSKVVKKKKAKKKKKEGENATTTKEEEAKLPPSTINNEYDTSEFSEYDMQELDKTPSKTVRNHQRPMSAKAHVNGDVIRKLIVNSQCKRPKTAGVSHGRGKSLFHFSDAKFAYFQNVKSSNDAPQSFLTNTNPEVGYMHVNPSHVDPLVQNKLLRLKTFHVDNSGAEYLALVFVHLESCIGLKNSQRKMANKVFTVLK